LIVFQAESIIGYVALPRSVNACIPLANDDETLVLVMDGWLSDWEELRAELLAKGSRLRTRADAELVLWAYEAWSNFTLMNAFRPELDRVNVAADFCGYVGKGTKGPQPSNFSHL
jgi:asparagine synthetase B (glutamine-hydrolysing)